MKAQKFLDPVEQARLEALKLYITKFMVAGFGLVVTNFLETPDKLLTEKQLEIKKLVSPYKVRLPYWTWIRCIFSRPKISYEVTPDTTNNGDMADAHPAPLPRE